MFFLRGSRELTLLDWLQRVISLQDHNECRRDTDVWQVVQINTVNFLRQMCHMADEFDDEQIQRICGILEVNAFEIKTRCNRIRGVFPLAAMVSRLKHFPLNFQFNWFVFLTFQMAHQCVVNTNHVILEKDYEMVVRASVPIQKGMSIYASYAHTLDGNLNFRKWRVILNFKKRGSFRLWPAPIKFVQIVNFCWL